MAQSSGEGWQTASYDSLLFELESLKQTPDIATLTSAYLDGDFQTVLNGQQAQNLFLKLSQQLSGGREAELFDLQDGKPSDATVSFLIFITGLAALDAFLQINVTGPPISFGQYLPRGIEATAFEQQCLASLEVDGVSIYQHVPGIELFCLARSIFTGHFPHAGNGNALKDCKWMRIRVNAYHQRLLSGLPGGRMSDSTLLQGQLDKDLRGLEQDIFNTESTFPEDVKVQFLLEKTLIYVMQGRDSKARENVTLASSVSGFIYALTGALGKRTRFQEKDISQLVVLAKSRRRAGGSDSALNSNLHFGQDEGVSVDKGSGTAPTELQLDDDTLLESVSFSKLKTKPVVCQFPSSELDDIQPGDQPQLETWDQITLLTEATIKDTFSPIDKLNSEEILPYAVRVLADKPTNWQVYTQALLVRSRIEAHRARTQERSVLQLQAIVDQIIAETQSDIGSSDGIPAIQVPQFLPRATSTESAPVTERLKYVHSLGSPTRWEIETELAYAWSSVGSFVSALEIFKRLRLWAEVALCYHQVGQEDKARQVVRRQLYHSSKGVEMDKYDIDAPEIRTEQWDGEMRDPPPHAPRLWCILGDLDQDPFCWQRAWELSKKRYARAQRSLGEYHTKQGSLDVARDAYMQATSVNRQNHDSWSRLGDIDLRMGNWDGAIIAFQQSIMLDDTNAKTYSNLGSALFSKHSSQTGASDVGSISISDEDLGKDKLPSQSDPKQLLRQSLTAYKKGASLAHDNWKIWDNVITIAGRMSPPSYADMLVALRAIISLRAPSAGEEAIDIDVLRLLVIEVTSHERPSNPNSAETKDRFYVPPRGSLARALMHLFDAEIVPLITRKAELWMLVEKMAFYRRDYAGALEAAEKAWRMLYSGNGTAWTEDEAGWNAMVGATEWLVGAYENYGGRDVDGHLVEKAWRIKARSAVRGVMGRGRDLWEGSEGWQTLDGLLDGLKS